MTAWAPGGRVRMRSKSGHPAAGATGASGHRHGTSTFRGQVLNRGGSSLAFASPPIGKIPRRPSWQPHERYQLLVVAVLRAKLGQRSSKPRSLKDF